MDKEKQRRTITKKNSNGTYVRAVVRHHPKNKTKRKKKTNKITRTITKIINEDKDKDKHEGIHTAYKKTLRTRTQRHGQRTTKDDHNEEKQ
jgi:hypothetical protein